MLPHVGAVRLPDAAQAVTNAQLWSLLNAAPAGMALLTAVRTPDDPVRGPITDFRYQLANVAHANLTPLRYDELAGKCVSEVFPNYRHHPFFALFTEAVRTQQSAQIEQPYQADGVDGWFAMRVVPNGDELMAIYDDVTETHRAQQEADRRTQELRAILDASLNSIISMTTVREGGEITDFRMDTANTAVVKSTFKPLDQITGRGLLEVFPGNRENGHFDLYRRVVTTGEPEQSTQYYRDEFGLEGWFEVSAVRQGPEQIVVTYNNVTGIKRQELELQRVNDRLVQTNNSALAAIASYSAIREKGPDGQPGRIVDFYFDSFSQTAEELTGLKAADVVGGRMLEMFPTVGTSGLFDKWVRLVETGETMRFTDYYNDGTIELWYDTKAVKWGDGFIQSYIDVSANMKYLRGLEQANQILRQANENLQQFAFVASHDLQEPLRKIITMSDLLTERYADGLGEGVDLLTRMQRAAQRMKALVRDLLDYARLATPELNREPVDLNKIVKDVLADIDQLVTDRKAVVEVGPLPIIEADARQVQQLMQNLLTNAVKYVADGKTPRVTISSRLLPREAVADFMADELLLQADQYYELTVTDNGIGFRPEYRERIFGTFQRLHTTTSPYQGTGIGLAIVKRVADNHGALVMADSEEGQGATFRVFWPVEA